MALSCVRPQDVAVASAKALYTSDWQSWQLGSIVEASILDEQVCVCVHVCAREAVLLCVMCVR